MVGLGKHEGDPRHNKMSHFDKVPMTDGDASLINDRFRLRNYIEIVSSA